MHFFLTAIGSVWALCAIYKSRLTSRGRLASEHRSIQALQRISDEGPISWVGSVTEHADRLTGSHGYFEHL